MKDVKSFESSNLEKKCNVAMTEGSNPRQKGRPQSSTDRKRSKPAVDGGGVTNKSPAEVKTTTEPIRPANYSTKERRN